MAYLRSSRFGLAVLLLAAAGCSGDLVLPRTSAEVRVSNVDGDQQTGTVGEGLPKPLMVQLRDEEGRPLVGRQVAFTVLDGPAPATLTPSTAVTDADGEAVGQWELGTVPGAYAAEARVLPMAGDASPATELPVVPFTATARVGPPDNLSADSETSEKGNAGEPVEEDPTVRVVDRYGNPVDGVIIRWTVKDGGGGVSDETTPTGADGRATVTWTLGNESGTHHLEARVDGDVTVSPVDFYTSVVCLPWFC